MSVIISSRLGSSDYGSHLLLPPSLTWQFRMQNCCKYPISNQFRSCRRISKRHSSSCSTSVFSIYQQDNSLHPNLIRQCMRNHLANLLQFPRKPVFYYLRLHGQVIVRGFQDDVFLANILLRSYSKSSCLQDAQALFDKMPQKNSVSWSSIVSMYVQHGYNEEALVVFLESLRKCDEKTNEFILASVIRACTHLGSFDQGAQLHCFVTKIGFDQCAYVGNSLVDFYLKTGEIEAAKIVFDNIVEKTVVNWTSIITGFVKSGMGEVSLQLFDQMRQADVPLDGHVFSSILNACSMLKFLKGGEQIHSYLLRRETEIDVFAFNALIDCYVKCGKVQTGRNLFNQMVSKDLLSWTIMIVGYVQNSFTWEAIKLFIKMKRVNQKPEGFVCTSVLTSCGSIKALELGRQVHSYAIKANLEHDEFVKNGLIDMYAKCNSLVDARQVFDFMADCNVVSYNAMIEGYSREQRLYEALVLFHKMRLNLLPPSILTFVSLLGISASLLKIHLGQQIHGIILKSGFSLDKFIGSALIDVYSKCSLINNARHIFNEIKEKDIVVWNAMLLGYAQQSENEEVVKLCSESSILGQNPDAFTFIALITATSNLASLLQGQQLHGRLVKSGLDLDPFITNSLIDMYAKCGCIEAAHKTFTCTPQKDAVAWNSMISTFSQHGRSGEALQMFESMVHVGIQPNYVTFVGVLSACSHAGFLDKGLHYFDAMHEFGIEPGRDHCACMVSLLGRMGKLYEAKEFIEKMPVKPDAITWRSLLSACMRSGNVELGQYAAEMTVLADPLDNGSYVLLSNIMASKGRWADAKEVRGKMKLSGVAKEPGISWIEVKNKVHVFKTGDKPHFDADLTGTILDGLIHHIGVFHYVPDRVTPMVND